MSFAGILLLLGFVLFAYYGEKQLDLSGLTAREQMRSVLEAEVEVLSAEEPVILLAAR